MTDRLVEVIRAALRMRLVGEVPASEFSLPMQTWEQPGAEEVAEAIREAWTADLLDLHDFIPR